MTYSSSDEDEFFDAASGANLTDESDTTEEDGCTSDCTESAESATVTTNGHQHKHRHYNKKRLVNLKCVFFTHSFHVILKFV